MNGRGRWTLWILWILASAAGGAAGWSVGAVAGEVEGGAASGFLGGSLSGLLQWPVLRQRLPNASWWVVASGLGWGVGVLVGLALESATVGAVKRTAGAPVALALVTTMQWLYLRRHVSRSGWWFLANFVALVLGGASVLAVSAIVGAPVVGAPGGAVLGGGIGAATGTALVWLLARTHGAQPKAPG